MIRYLAAALLLGGACTALPTGLGWRRVVGLVDIGSGATPLQAPDTVTAGTPFRVVVTTYGSSSCTRPNGADVRVNGLVAEITPYDREAPPSTPCTADLRPFPRDVQVRFATPGTGLVRVIGRVGREQRPAAEARVVVRP